MFYRVFLDTNIYDGAAYSFHNAAFQKMREYSLQGELCIVTNSIIDGEVRSHIKANIAKAVNVLNKAAKDRFFALFRKLPEYENIVECHKKQNWINTCIVEYDSLLQDCNAVQIGVSDIDVEKMVSDYFLQKPPFETKKPDEFKDAIAASSVILDIKRVFSVDYTNSAQDDIMYCIISNDAGFRKAIQANCDSQYIDKVRVFDDLHKFLDYSSMMDKQAQFLKAFLISEYGMVEMEETVREAVKCASLDINLETGEFIDEQDCLDVTDIEYTPYILGIYEEDGQPMVAKVLLETKCTVKVWYCYTDEDNSYYDKEDQEYLWKTEIEKEGRYCIDLDLVVSLLINDCVMPDGWTVGDQEFDFSEKTIQFNDYLDIPEQISLDDDNLIDEEVLSKNDPFTEYEFEGETQQERAYSQCPDCGTPISRINDGGNGFCINCSLNH